MIKKLAILTFALAIASAANFSNAQLLSENFDNAAGFTASELLFSDGFGDYFGISDGVGGGDFGIGSIPANEKTYVGMTGNYLTGMDMNGEGATMPITVTWSGINITGAGGLVFGFDLAEAFDAPGDIDIADFILVEAQIDAGGFVEILQFRGDLVSFNGFFRVDTNGDGVGDGALIGGIARRMTAAIAGTGASLDLRISLSVDSGDEDFAIDNVTIHDTVPVQLEDYQID